VEEGTGNEVLPVASGRLSVSLHLEKERREVMDWSMKDEVGLGWHSPVRLMAAVETEISVRAMATSASIVDNRQWGSAREQWGALVRLESCRTEDWVKGAVCGRLLTEAEERAKGGGGGARKVLGGAGGADVRGNGTHVRCALLLVDGGCRRPVAGRCGMVQGRRRMGPA
jgi:hypothetical protein